MGKLSDADANNMLDSRFGAGASGASNAPATYYIALSTTTPTNTGGSVTEPSANGYARVAVTNNSTNWPAASARVKSNGATFTFPTATGSWGTITHFALYDASTAGTFRGWGVLSSPRSITTGDTPDFPAGSLSIDGS